MATTLTLRCNPFCFCRDIPKFNPLAGEATFLYFGDSNTKQTNIGVLFLNVVIVIKSPINILLAKISTFDNNLFKMETLLVMPENNEQLKAVKAVLKALHVDFISKKENQYDKEFVEKIEESRRQAKEGKISILDTDNLSK